MTSRRYFRIAGIALGINLAISLLLIAVSSFWLQMLAGLAILIAIGHFVTGLRLRRQEHSSSG